MKTIAFILFVCLLGVQSLDAQDFVQPIRTNPVRIKKQKTARKDKRTTRVPIKEMDYQHFKLSVNAGFSDHTYQWVEKIPTPLTGYVKNLKAGSNFGLDFQYYPVEPVGFGMKYSAYNGKSSKAILTSPSSYSTQQKDLSIQFIGPCISTRYLHADLKNAVFFNMAYGYVDYRLNYQYDTEFSARGNTMATVYDLGYDIGLTQNIGIGVKVSYLRGALKEYEGTLKGQTQRVYLETGKYERLHRLDFSIGLKLNL